MARHSFTFALSLLATPFLFSNSVSAWAFKPRAAQQTVTITEVIQINNGVPVTIPITIDDAPPATASDVSTTIVTITEASTTTLSSTTLLPSTGLPPFANSSSTTIAPGPTAFPTAGSSIEPPFANSTVISSSTVGPTEYPSSTFVTLPTTPPYANSTSTALPGTGSSCGYVIVTDTVTEAAATITDTITETTTPYDIGYTFTFISGTTTVFSTETSTVTILTDVPTDWILAPTAVPESEIMFYTV